MARFPNLRPVVWTLALASLIIAGRRESEAHKVVTSPYTYNNEIFPILRDHCGRCHVEGGPAPMGLVVWNDGPNSAAPWAESIRALLVSEQMPPWYVDPAGPAVKGGFALSAAQSDKLLTWVTGGTPEGDENKKLARFTYQARWSGGPPDLSLPMETEYTMAAETSSETREFVISTNLTETRWLKAVDLLPGAPSIVRTALISVESGPVLAVWSTGDDLVAAPGGAAFRLPAGAKLRVQIHYQKHWQNEGNVIKDRSIVGLYFTDQPVSGMEIQSLSIHAPTGPASEGFAGVLSVRARVVAIRPSLDRAYGSFIVEAITPSGVRTPLLKLRAPRPEWRRRYWLADPIELPAGSRIEVTRTPIPGYFDLTGANFTKTYPLQVALDFVAQP
jgi:hypothetical protein